MPIYLASTSPRRFSLLCSCGLQVEVIEAPVLETRLNDESPSDMVQRLADIKAQAALPFVSCPWPIVAGDTVVALGNEIFGKPIDRDDAIAMLSILSGKEHQVVSGFCVIYGDKKIVDVVSTSVSFRALTTQEIIDYVDRGEPFGKAGSYAVQGEAIPFIDQIHGSLTNVIGLPLREVLRAIEEVRKDDF